MVTTSSVQNHVVVQISRGIEEFPTHSKKDLLISKIWKLILLFLVALFSVSAEEVPQKYQIELIELQCNSVLKAKFKNVDTKMFYQYIEPTYLQIKEMASRTKSMSASRLSMSANNCFSSMNLKQASISISIDRCALPLNVKSCDCTIFGSRY